MKRSHSSMQLTRAADYGMRAMMHLVAAAEGERVSLPDLARATGAPESFLSKVLQSLARAGLIVSRRGQLGGFHITPQGAAASVREVVEAIDGPIFLNACIVCGRSCTRKPRCAAHPVWMEAQEAMLNVLSAATIAGIVDRQDAKESNPRTAAANSTPLTKITGR